MMKINALFVYSNPVILLMQILQEIFIISNNFGLVEEKQVYIITCIGKKYTLVFIIITISFVLW